MNAAIDSFPLTDSIFNCADYSGLQVHLLTHRPLASSVPACGAEKILRIPLGEELVWSDGSRITAAHYLKGIERALSLNPFIRKFLFRHINKVSVEGNNLTIEMNRINFRLREILSLPCFSPDCGKPLSSGDWILRERTDNRMHFFSSHEELNLRLVTSPEQNLELFENGALDISADTAFPYSRYIEFAESAEIKRHSVGLNMVLTFAGELASPARTWLRRQVAAVCAQTSFASVNHNVCPRLSAFDYENAVESVATASKPLALAYDDFYPNRQICEGVADALAQVGIRVQLVRDDYYQPHVNYDLKLSILRGLGASDYLLYTSLLFSPVLRQDRTLQNRYGQLLRELERQTQVDSSSIKNFISEHALLVPLFEVPSLYLTRVKCINPLIQGVVV